MQVWYPVGLLQGGNHQFFSLTLISLPLFLFSLFLPLFLKINKMHSLGWGFKTEWTYWGTRSYNYSEEFNVFLLSQGSCILGSTEISNRYQRNYRRVLPLGKQPQKSKKTWNFLWEIKKWQCSIQNPNLLIAWVQESLPINIFNNIKPQNLLKSQSTMCGTVAWTWSWYICHENEFI